MFSRDEEEDGDDDEDQSEGEDEQEEDNPWAAANDEEDIDESDGPDVFMIPESLENVTVTINPTEPLGLSITSEGWIDSCEPQSQAATAGARRGLRIIRVESRLEWSLVASLREIKAVLAITKGSGDTQLTLLCSSKLSGELKWQGGVAGLDGRIYGVPANSREVLTIDTREGSVSTFGRLLSADLIYGDVEDRWCGGVLTKDGKIIGIPFNGSQYLEIDPLQGTAAPKGNALLFGKHKWRGGALCLFGRVHCIPAEANCVLRIDPKSGEWATFGELSAAGDGSKWNGGCFSDYDDRIYGVPFDAESVLAIDPDMQTVGLLYENALPAECAGMRGKWSGGVISAKDGCMYCVPFNAPSVLKVDFRAHKMEALGHFKGRGKWCGGVAAPDGAIWCVPHCASTWLRIDVDRQVAALVGRVPHDTQGHPCQFRGGALGIDGNVYAIPADASAALRLNTSKSSFY